jgi:tetratricopeptide (TPR) repeat protein
VFPLALSFHQVKHMKLFGAIGIAFVAFAVSLPGMYLLKNGKTINWDWTEGTANEDKEEKDNPEVDVLCLKGLMFMSEGQHDKAITAYSEAIKLDPKYSFSYLGRGDVYVAKGDMDRARTDYDHALRLDPDNDAASDRVKLMRAQQSQK